MLVEPEGAPADVASLQADLREEEPPILNEEITLTPLRIKLEKVQTPTRWVMFESGAFFIHQILTICVAYLRDTYH